MLCGTDLFGFLSLSKQRDCGRQPRGRAALSRHARVYVDERPHGLLTLFVLQYIPRPQLNVQTRETANLPEKVMNRSEERATGIHNTCGQEARTVQHAPRCQLLAIDGAGAVN